MTKGVLLPLAEGPGGGRHHGGRPRLLREPDDPKKSYALVDVKPLMPVKDEVSLRQIKADPRLQHLPLVRQSRLSVSPIDDEAWAIICGMAGVKP